MPKRTVDDIKVSLLRPALTSHFEVRIPIPGGLTNEYLSANGVSGFVGINQDKLNLLCSETSLPGSNIGTMDITGDFHGVTQRHANRRIYDDRIDMTFYVDAENYLPIRYFETWIKYIVGESITPSGSRPGSLSPEYFYRLNYPDLYICKQGLTVTKFERDYQSALSYQFINAFPISVASMPISYDSSSLLKCTVSFTYIRYILVPPSINKDPEHIDATSQEPTNGDPSSPNQQAFFNSAQFGTSSVSGANQISGSLSGTGALSVGTFPQSAANASGNTTNAGPTLAQEFGI